MEDTTLIWFLVLSVLVMNYKWHQGKWRTTAVTVCQPRWLCVHYWVGNFFSSVHCMLLSTAPLFCLLSLCFHFPAGDWKARGSAAPSAYLWSQKGKAQAKREIFLISEEVIGKMGTGLAHSWFFDYSCIFGSYSSSATEFSLFSDVLLQDMSAVSLVETRVFILVANDCEISWFGKGKRGNWTRFYQDSKRCEWLEQTALLLRRSKWNTWQSWPLIVGPRWGFEHLFQGMAN